MSYKTRSCEVCDGQAVGRNFGAITCDPCKTFFRRNATKNKTFKCYTKGNCILNSTLSYKCKKCRIEKCRFVGMKSELIRKEKEKGQRKIQTQDNNHMKEILNNSMKTLDLIQNNFLSKNIENNLIIGETICYNFISTSNTVRHNQNTNALEGIHNKSNNCPIVPVFRHISDKSFNDLEMNRLSELISASNALTFEFNKNNNNLELTNISDINRVFFSKAENDLKDVIKFMKRLNSFKSLCENDKLALVKFGTFESLILRNVLFFNLESENWFILVDNNSSFFFKLCHLKVEKRNAYVIYRNYFMKLIPEWNRDSIVLDLLTAIAIFNPSRPNITHRDVIKHEQQLYIYLLQRYLQLRYRSELESMSKMSKLMNTLIDLKTLCEIEKLNGVEDYPQYFGPLLREILDIK